MRNKTSMQLTDLSATKRALLEKHLSGQSVSTADSRSSVILQRTGHEQIPLSFSQQRLWFLNQFDSQNVAYNLSATLKLRGRLNVEAVEHCFNEIIRRHEVLRTAFTTRGDNPIQIITPESNFSVAYTDLSNLPGDICAHEALRLAKEEALRPFDLSTGPLLRVCLLGVGEQAAKQDYLLFLTLHHIVADGWSLGILIREFSVLYKACHINQTSPLPELPIQYADFAIWQRGQLQGAMLERHLAYWTQRLEGSPTLLELPFDRPRPAVCSYQGARYSFSMPKSLTVRLYDLSKKEKTTLFVTLITVFNVLLYRYSRQCDINIGYPIANRTQVETEGLIGFFVNTLVLRTDLSGNPPFVELLGQVRDRVLDAQIHQELPFERIVEELQPARSLSYNPLFQVMFALQNMPMENLELPDLHIERLPLETGVSLFDLSLLVTERDGGLDALFEYSTDLFEECSVGRMASHFVQLLECFSVSPDALIGSLSLLTNNERLQILGQWNTQETVYPGERLLHELFEKMAEERPHAEVLVCKTGRLSYRELNERANWVAHELRKLGVGPETYVGLCLERSPEALVGMIGILKAGGAYVPLDPNYPKERLAFMLADCGASLVLTKERYLDLLTECDLKMIFMDRDWPFIAVQPVSLVANLNTPDNTAYLIFTSGSTGKPKGVVVSHRNAVASTTTRFKYYQEKVDGFLLLSSFAFDSSVAGIFWTLGQGGRLCFPSEEEVQEPAALLEWIAKERLTHLLCLPSLYGLLLDQASSFQLTSLRTAIVAGETCPRHLPAKHAHLLSSVRLYNEYGPTENTVWSSVYEVRARDLETDRPIPIGCPIANSQIYLLDSYLNPVPIGIPGELYIGGAGLTRGYLGRPDLTAERYMPNPFSKTPGNRLYKTGDLARYRPDGNIEFLGRIDHQVKIRGFRIELGEIENRLRQYPGIQEAVVIAHEDTVGNKRLVAYWVNVPDFSPEIETMRTFLRETLPDYMIPAAFVRLDKLPLTPNGKLDHKALPDPDFNGRLAQRYSDPRNTIEEILVKIWRQILGLERIGIYDNFFALGGDSIMAIQMVGRARQVDLIFTPHQIFQQQTIAELANVAGRVANAQRSEQGAISGVVPLTPIQCWFFEQNLPNPSHWNQAVLLEVKGFVEPLIFEQAVMYLISHHDALRSRFSLEDDMWRQNTLMQESHLVFHRVDLSEVDQTEQVNSIETECNRWQASLHLTKGPLLRMVWFDLGAGCNSRLLLAIHHLVVDGVSWRILLEDLQTICRQLMQGETVALPPKTTSFKYWAERLHQWAQNEDLQKEVAYWLHTTQAVAAPFPVDYPDGTREDRHTATVIADLGEAETHALLREASAAYRTEINDLLLAALAQTLTGWINASDVVIDIEGHGREELFDDVDLSRTVGWFTSVYPVRLNLPLDNNSGAVIKAVKEEIRHIPHKGIGYQVLRYLSRDETGERFKTHFGSQVLFNYLGQLDRVLPEDSLFARSWESAGREQDAVGLRSYELEINAHISREKLHIAWTYSGARYRRKTIEVLATSYMQALQELIAHCLSPDAGGFTPSDFPLAVIGQVKLDSLISRFAKKHK
jgi:amino acid adenylation domain-containing protein/non-ribosomal peptide synthase protein (TIGR01720 family)